MNLLRRILHPPQMTVRLMDESDRPAVVRLFETASRRYLSVMGEELSLLPVHGLVVVLASDADIWGAIVTSRVIEQTTWIRAVALARGVEIHESIQLMLSFLHHTLGMRDVRHVFYAGDESSSEWLMPLLKVQGYAHDTEVIVYEKHTMNVPSNGNHLVRVRPAQHDDLDAIRLLDRVCFEPQWVKDVSILESALREKTLFLVAELDLPMIGYSIVGYTYASSHFNGRLVHLVRLAVDPSQQRCAVGVRMLAEVVAFARLLNAHVITLNTQRYNHRAQQLYDWFGFVPSGDNQTIVRYDLVARRERENAAPTAS